MSKSTLLSLREEDIVRLICEFLQNRDLRIAQFVLERESGIINGSYSADLRFLRQLIFDGHWNNVMDFINPLTCVDAFDYKMFRFIILKTKFLELINHKNEPTNVKEECAAVESVVEILKEIEEVSPNKEQYNQLCLLLTLNRISDHPEYKSWNPSQGRITCFDQVLPLVRDFLSNNADDQEHSRPNVAVNDRLIQLIIKGILYESSIDFCQQRAANASESSSSSNKLQFSSLLSNSHFSDSDLSLLSWLQAIPSDTFVFSFEQQGLNVAVERLKKPEVDSALLSISNTTGSSKIEDQTTKKYNIENQELKQSDNCNDDDLVETEYVKNHVETDVSDCRGSDIIPKQFGNFRFVPSTTLEDIQAIRCADFHPQGNVYAVGSNSKVLRICKYPIPGSSTHLDPTVLFMRTKYHKGSIYCLGWNKSGNILATGSNDKTVKVIRYNESTCSLDGNNEIELNMHDGTVRDCIFLNDVTLASAGAGDCKIYLTDVFSGAGIQSSLVGHSSHVLTLCTWGMGGCLASGSHDKTVRFWDTRSAGSCVGIVQYGIGASPVTSCSVDPSGRLLVTGHENASCFLYDIRGGRNILSMQPHTSDVRSVRFSSPNAYYLLTASYDGKIALFDLKGDLSEQPLPHRIVAEHQDKIISARWHPTEFSFISASADKTAILWMLSS